MPQEFRFSKKLTALASIPLGGFFAIIQSFFVISGLLWLVQASFSAPLPTAPWIIYGIGVFICAFFTSLVGLLELKWDAVIIGTVAGIAFIILTSQLTTPLVVFLLCLTTLVTYLAALIPRIRLEKLKFVSDLNFIIAAHILCDFIVLGSLLASIQVEWVRPFVVAEVFIVLFSWWLLGGCPFTVAEVKLNDSASKKLIQNGFLVYYGRTYFGIKIDEFKFEKTLDHIFYATTALIILSWFL